MKICIYGAGAIGGFIGAKLAAKGEAEVSLVARGPHLLAMQANGLTVKEKDRKTNVRVTATDRPAELGPQDYVILALKAHSVPAVLESIKPLFGPDTAVVTAQNGLPWWYFYKHGGAHENRRVESVDPGGRIWSAIGPERAIGCVVYIAAEIESPGVVRHVEYDRLPLGEPSGEKSERVLAACAAAGAGRHSRRCPSRHPQRHLGQAMGQSLVQSDLGIDRRHARADRGR